MLADKLRDPGQKRLLAVDGGGIRGVIALEVLREVERLLGDGDPEFRLAHYFHYIAGNSTGAIVAAGLALGMRVDELLAFYQDHGARIFDRASVLKRFQFKFEDEALSELLKSVIGADTALGSERLQTLLAVVLRNATTDSPWTMSNNPYARYNDRGRDDCNLALPLWELVRASTAAPTYFPPEHVRIGAHDFLFVDGGVTTYNNPAFLTYLMATVSAYWPLLRPAEEPDVAWPAEVGADRLLLVSVGTGAAADANVDLMPDDLNLLYHAASVPAALMAAASAQQDMLCRVFGDCRAGPQLDNELRDLRGFTSKGAVADRLFSYVRYNADLSQHGLNAVGLADVRAAEVQPLDSVVHLDKMRAVGRRTAERQVRAEHFAGFAGG